MSLVERDGFRQTLKLLRNIKTCKRFKGLKKLIL